MKIHNEEELKQALRKMLAMLEKPEWGLMTFCMMYADLYRSIVQYWEEN